MTDSEVPYLLSLSFTKMVVGRCILYEYEALVE